VPRDSFVLSTKIGRLLVPGQSRAVADENFYRPLPFDTPFDYSYDGTLRSFEDSLQRLGMSRIDILFIHDVDVWTHGSREAADARFEEVMTGGYRALVKLRDEGAVGAIGAGLNEWDACQRFAERGDFDCFLLAGRYTLLDHVALQTFLPACARRGVGVIVGAPYNSGVLARGAVEGATYFDGPPPPAVLEKVRRLERTCAAHGVSLAAAALRFPLGHPVVASVLPGVRSAADVRRTVDLFDETIPDDLWLQLKSEGIIHAEAPVPEN